MYTLDRSVAIIRPKQAFMDWANQLPDAHEKFSIEEFQIDCVAVLVREYDTDKEARARVAKIGEALFEDQLREWTTNEEWWPQKRSRKLFWEWFDVEFHSLVIDPYEAPPVREAL